MIAFGTWDLATHIHSGATNPRSTIIFGDEKNGFGWFFPPITEMGSNRYSKNWITAAWNLAIPKKAKNPEASFAYVKHLVYGKGLEIFWRDRWNFPAKKGLIERTTDWQTEALKQECLILNERLKNPKLFFRRDLLVPPVTDIFYNQLGGFFAGTLSASDVLNAAQEAQEKFMAKK